MNWLERATAAEPRNEFRSLPELREKVYRWREATRESERRMSRLSSEKIAAQRQTLDWVEYAKSHGVEGFLHPSELSVLVELATDRDVLEVGSYRGLSAWGMAHTAKHVTCVDTFKACTNGQRQEDNFTTLAEFDRVTAGFSNVARVPVSSERAIELIPGDFDMVFLDAMHDYENVLADILRWWPRVRPGGILCGHDYGHDDFKGVKQAFDEVFGPAPPGPEFVTVTLRVIHMTDEVADGKPVPAEWATA